MFFAQARFWGYKFCNASVMGGDNKN